MSQMADSQRQLCCATPLALETAVFKSPQDWPSAPPPALMGICRRTRQKFRAAVHRALSKTVSTLSLSRFADSMSLLGRLQFRSVLLAFLRLILELEPLSQIGTGRANIRVPAKGTGLAGYRLTAADAHRNVHKSDIVS